MSGLTRRFLGWLLRPALHPPSRGFYLSLATRSLVIFGNFLVSVGDTASSGTVSQPGSSFCNSSTASVGPYTNTMRGEASSTLWTVGYACEEFVSCSRLPVRARKM